MKTHTGYLSITTAERYAILDITDKVAKIIADSKVDDGMVLVSAMHITASIFVNDHESGLW